MSAKPVIPRELARRDVDESIGYFLNSEAEKAALDFINALERAYGQIGRQPRSGSQRYAHELSFPGLRFWQLRRFPHLVFYVERDDHIDVLRVLHGMRDIPLWLLDIPDAS